MSLKCKAILDHLCGYFCQKTEQRKKIMSVTFYIFATYYIMGPLLSGCYQFKEEKTYTDLRDRKKTS